MNHPQMSDHEPFVTAQADLDEALAKLAELQAEQAEAERQYQRVRDYGRPEDVTALRELEDRCWQTSRAVELQQGVVERCQQAHAVAAADAQADINDAYAVADRAALAAVEQAVRGVLDALDNRAALRQEWAHATEKRIPRPSDGTLAIQTQLRSFLAGRRSKQAPSANIRAIQERQRERQRKLDRRRRAGEPAPIG